MVQNYISKFKPLKREREVWRTGPLVSLSDHRLRVCWLGLGGQSAVRFAVSFGGSSDERGEV